MRVTDGWLPQTTKGVECWDRCYDFENIFAKKIWRKNKRILLKVLPVFEKIDRNVGL
jgi:hypothetical protein